MKCVHYVCLSLWCVADSSIYVCIYTSIYMSVYCLSVIETLKDDYECKTHFMPLLRTRGQV